MSLQMRRGDHNALGLLPFACRDGEDAIKNTQLAPADEALVELLVGPIERPLITRRSSTHRLP
jgi:hypothetical protein